MVYDTPMVSKYGVAVAAQNSQKEKQKSKDVK